MLWDALKLWGVFCSTIMGIYYVVTLSFAMCGLVWAAARNTPTKDPPAPQPLVPHTTCSPPPDSAPPAPPPMAPHLPPDGQSITLRRPSQDIKLLEQQHDQESIIQFS